jgi:proto-oncogene serine/threonine-protein kinase Pim-2
MENPYIIQERIGSGSFGKIYQAIRMSNREEVIIKRVAKRNARTDTDNNFLEVKYLKKAADLPNVTTLIDVFTTRMHLFLVFKKERGSIMDLNGYINLRQHISERKGKYIFMQLVRTVLELQIRGILHNDIKDENVLISLPDLRVTIIDFGSATKFKADEEYTSYRGTAEYAPPEWVQTGRFRAEGLNVWTLGKLVMVCRKLPNIYINLGFEKRTLKTCLDKPRP